MPIFIALIDLMRRLPWFITRVRELYYNISRTILSVPDIIQGRTNIYSEGFFVGQSPGSPLFELMVGKTNEAIRADFLARNDEILNVSNYRHFSRFIDSFFPNEWEQIKELVSVEPEIYDSLITMLNERESIQSFLGINLVTAVNAGGIFTPAIVIPILSGGTSFLLSWVSMKMNPAGDQSQKMQRIMMMVAMPLMMFFFTFGISGGVGVYWIAGNIIAIIQQVLLMKFYVNRKPKVTVENP
jgi:membrane protein insertase Oxa1/YidC/SpoIIIJ